jgi:hypothetical protein
VTFVTLRFHAERQELAHQAAREGWGQDHLGREFAAWFAARYPLAGALGIATSGGPGVVISALIGIGSRPAIQRARAGDGAVVGSQMHAG